KLREIAAGQFQVRHIAAGLDDVRLLQPLPEIPGRILQSFGGEHLPPRDVRQVRRILPLRIDPTDVMTIRACKVSEELAARRGISSRRRRRSRGLSSEPGLVGLRRVDNDPESHPGMLRATIFSAGAAEDTGVFRAHPYEVLTPRHSVDFAGELRNPEVMDHIGGVDFDKRVLLHRNMDFIRSDDLTRVADFPPPLMRVDHDIRRAPDWMIHSARGDNTESE